MCFGGGGGGSSAPTTPPPEPEAPPAKEPTKFDYSVQQQDSAKLAQQRSAINVLSTTDPSEKRGTGLDYLGA